MNTVSALLLKSPLFSNKSGNNIKFLMPRNMCWDSICNAAEVWFSSEHYLWLFDGGLYPFTAMYCCRAVVSSSTSETTLASGLQTLSLEGASYSVSRCVRT